MDNLTLEQQQKVNAWIADKNLQKCPTCGSIGCDVTKPISPRFVDLVTHEEGTKGLLLLPLVCKNCKVVTFLGATEILGLS